MRLAWRLARQAWLGRGRRFALISLASALATTLVVAVSCAQASLIAGMRLRAESTLGRSDLRVKELAGGAFPESVAMEVASRPEVELAVPRAKGVIPVQHPDTGRQFSMTTLGVDPALENRLVASALGEGRNIRADGEVLLDADIAETLGAKVGDRLLNIGAHPNPPELLVVGIQQETTVRLLRNPQAVATANTVRLATGESARTQRSIAEIQVVLRESALDGRPRTKAVEAIAASWRSFLPDSVVAEPTPRVLAGVSSAVRANEFFYVIFSVLAFLCAAIIITTGLTTSVLERVRELAILRCIGATRAVLVTSQAFTGLAVGLIGALLGAPLGVALAALIAWVFPDRLPSGLHVSASGLAWAVSGSAIAGLLASAWPAVLAARVTPLEGLARRAREPRARSLVLATLLGLAGLTLDRFILTASDDAQAVFRLHVFLGLPLLLFGMFLLGAPISLAVSRLLGPLVARLFHIPSPLLKRSARSAPFRQGFTAGALMVGVALLTGVWTNGTAVLRDWLDQIKFPDAFITHPLGVTNDARARVDALPFVDGTCAITVLPIESTAFGVAGIRNPPVNFIAFEPEPFFRMTSLHWAAGDPEYAKRRLREGGAVIVAQEFLINREGYGVGQSFDVTLGEQSASFEIVGAVSSPGLDVVSLYFNIGRDYADKAVSSVFCSRADLQRVFSVDHTHLLQVGLKGDLPDQQVVAEIKRALGSGAYLVGSGRQILNSVRDIGLGMMRIATLIAIGAMAVATLAALNVIVAGVDARRHEFGVIRAVGGGAGTLARLVLAETALLAITACVMGVALGLQTALAGQRLQALLAGIELPFKPPPIPILLGCLALLTVALLTVAPLALRLARQRPITLLSSVRG